MALYVLDSDILSLFEGGHSAVVARVVQTPAEQLAVTIITVEEQLSGWYTARRRTKSREKLAYIYDRFTRSVRFLSQTEILSFTEQAIERFENLRRMKLGVKANDLRIAAIALENSAVVVTRNRADFGRVPGLQIEDWSVQ
jgi:tRNA(fMet)-specific endonuclease VapC